MAGESFPNPFLVHRFALHRHRVGDMTRNRFQMPPAFFLRREATPAFNGFYPGCLRHRRSPDSVTMSRKTSLQSLHAPVSLSITSLATSAISLLLCCSNSISYGVSIRGAGEVPSLRLSEAVEGVVEALPPPLLKIRSVLFAEFMQLAPGGIQFSGVWFTC